MQRLAVQFGVLAVVLGLAAVALGVGGFGTATVDRGGAADIANNGNATLGVEADDYDGSVGSEFTLLNVTNHFEAEITEVTVEIKQNDPPINITDTPDSISVDGTEPVTAECEGSTDGTERIDITTTAEAKSTAVQTESSVYVTCNGGESG
jgi:FlaG/FlaF family flagellin (archaellin)